MQPSLVLNHMIALQGIYPSRDLVDGEDGSGIGGGSLEPLIGQLGLFAGTFAPRGWALTDGQLLPIAQNEALFSLLGTTYGGDGRTTFGLPDLRSRVGVHEGTGNGLTNRRLGERFGSEEVQLNLGQLPVHDHTLPGTTDVTGVAGASQAHANIQPSLGINYLIAVEGTYPSRNILAEDDGGTGSGGLDPLLAEVRPFAGNFAPRGWAFADGNLLQISQNTALFSLLGTTYGGDGRTTFGLPDLRGRTPIHSGQGPGLSHRPLGGRWGSESETLNISEMPSHVHLASPPGPGPFTGATGGGSSHNNTQPSLALNYIIALQGVYPSRNILTEDDEAGSGGGVEPFLGEIRVFAGNFAPRGWALADGQLLSIPQNDALFSLLGTTYGGDGRTTFGLPDLRGRAAMHAGTGPGLSSRTLGSRLGEERSTLSVLQLPIHSHVVPVPGDFDKNGVVDGEDFLVWQANFNQHAGDATPNDGDANGDGLVNGEDFLIWQIAYGEGQNGTRSLAVPEPSGVATLAIVVLCGVVLRRGGPKLVVG